MKAPFLFWSEETGLTCPTPGAPCIPRRRPPASSSTHGTPAHHRQQGRPCQMQGRPCKARHAHPDTEHVTPVCTRYQAGHAGQIVPAAGRWTACNASGKVYIFGRLFLSIFIWIYFVEIIDNPYIYGYNIISPDKYGLQPH